MQSIAGTICDSSLMKKEGNYSPKAATRDRNEDGQERHENAGIARCESHCRPIVLPTTPVDPGTVIDKARHVERPADNGSRVFERKVDSRVGMSS